jgi:hypothetical protein
MQVEGTVTKLVSAPGYGAAGTAKETMQRKRKGNARDLQILFACILGVSNWVSHSLIRSWKEINRIRLRPPTLSLHKFLLQFLSASQERRFLNPLTLTCAPNYQSLRHTHFKFPILQSIIHRFSEVSQGPIRASQMLGKNFQCIANYMV